MQDGPTSIELLEAARAALLDDMLPALPEERKLDGLMIANALAIVGRELASGDGPARAELAALEALLGEPAADTGTATALAARLRALNRRLCEEIRAGAFDSDPARRAALAPHLREVTMEKLRESNPKYLKAAGLT